MIYDFELSRRLNAVRPSRATNRFKIELQSNVSEALSASIIRELCDICPLSVTYITYAPSCMAPGHPYEGPS
jgi:hypothetical protein